MSRLRFATFEAATLAAIAEDGGPNFFFFLTEAVVRLSGQGRTAKPAPSFRGIFVET
jgi:hypothetical protein